MKSHIKLLNRQKFRVQTPGISRSDNIFRRQCVKVENMLIHLKNKKLENYIKVKKNLETATQKEIQEIQRRFTESQRKDRERNKRREYSYRLEVLMIIRK